jgi:hypothetical protein
MFDRPFFPALYGWCAWTYNPPQHQTNTRRHSLILERYEGAISMDPHYQRLKELDSDTFQRLCFQVLKEKHPGLALKHVEGAAGDEGLDVFEGELYGQPAIWQCKSFPNGVGQTQREQIRKSLRTALKHFAPSSWILCLSVDMDAKASKWFEKLQKSCASHVKIGLFSASDIVHEVMHRRSLRNHFFPGAALDPIELKRLITKTGELSLEELQNLTENNLEDVIERLKERDARFNYQIVFDGDIGPPAPHQAAVPGLVMSFSTGAKTVNVIARDVQALLSNPPSFRISLKGTGIEKALAARKTGLRQEFTTDEVGPITSNWPLLESLLQSDAPPKRMVLAPSPELTGRKRSMRVTFRLPGALPVEYGLMELKPTRIGTDEAEFVCNAKAVPFELSVVVPMPLDLQAQPQITVRHRSHVGTDVKQVKKFLDAMALLRASGEIEFFDLEEEKVFAIMAASGLADESAPERAFHQMVNDLAAISERFRVELQLPSDISDEDLESILLLKTYAENGTLSLNNISAVLLKSEENRDLIPQLLTTSGGVLRFEHQKHEPLPKLFGKAIDTGPCAMEATVQLQEQEAMLREFRAAAIGNGVSMSFRPIGKVRFLLLSIEKSV